MCKCVPVHLCMCVHSCMCAYVYNVCICVQCVCMCAHVCVHVHELACLLGWLETRCVDQFGLELTEVLSRPRASIIGVCPHVWLCPAFQCGD